MINGAMTKAFSGSIAQQEFNEAPISTLSSPLYVDEFQNPPISDSSSHVIPYAYRPGIQNGLCNAVLDYINNVLMEDDDFEDEATFLTCSRFNATKRSFHDIIAGDESHGRYSDDIERTSINKFPADCADESVIHEMFGKIVNLYGKNEESTVNPLYGSLAPKGLSKREAIDMRNLLLQCMQFVASNDHTAASRLLKEITSHTSIYGDGTQRLAHYFANGLQFRLDGARTLQHTTIAHGTLTDSTLLKAFKIYLTDFPFLETAYFFANQMIMEVAEKAKTLHVIHLGIMLGLQWPPLIQSLSERPGGPPKLRITAIDYPQTGLRPDATLKETGRRLSNYCREFNIPFEYKYLSKSWESVKIEELRLEEGEVVAINCMYHSMYLLDDTVLERSPRDTFLNTMRSINPAIFIHVVANGAYSNPFFVSRFREALFHFSTWFDMFDTILPRESPERMVFEREIWGKEVMNVIASEGLHRKERPEPYKQWHKRTTRAGFKHIKLNRNIVNEIRARVKMCYHKDFFVDEAGPWLLDGWKGRAVFGLSCWKPTKSGRSHAL